MKSYFFSQTQTPYTQDDGTLYYHDPVTIYDTDGLSDQAIQIAKLSGNLGSFGISSNGTSIFVKFESSQSTNNYGGDGFFATIHYGNQCTNDMNFSISADTDNHR